MSGWTVDGFAASACRRCSSTWGEVVVDQTGSVNAEIGTVVTVELFARTGAGADDGDDLDGSVPVAEGFDGDYEVEGPATDADIDDWQAWRDRERPPLRHDVSEQPDTACAVDVYGDDPEGLLTLYRLVDHRSQRRVVVQSPPGAVTSATVIEALPDRLDHDDFETHEVADL